MSRWKSLPGILLPFLNGKIRPSTLKNTAFSLLFLRDISANYYINSTSREHSIGGKDSLLAYECFVYRLSLLRDGTKRFTLLSKGEMSGFE